MYNIVVVKIIKNLILGIMTLKRKLKRFREGREASDEIASTD